MDPAAVREAGSELGGMLAAPVTMPIAFAKGVAHAVGHPGDVTPEETGQTVAAGLGTLGTLGMFGAKAPLTPADFDVSIAKGVTQGIRESVVRAATEEPAKSGPTVAAESEMSPTTTHNMDAVANEAAGLSARVDAEGKPLPPLNDTQRARLRELSAQLKAEGEKTAPPPPLAESALPKSLEEPPILPSDFAERELGRPLPNDVGETPNVVPIISTMLGEGGKTIGEIGSTLLEKEGPSGAGPSSARPLTPRRGVPDDANLENYLTKGTVEAGKGELPESVANTVLREAAARRGEKVPMPWDGATARVQALQPRVNDILNRSPEKWSMEEAGAVHSVMKQEQNALNALWRQRDQIIADEGISSFNVRDQQLSTSIAYKLAKMSLARTAWGRLGRFFQRWVDDIGYDGFETEALRMKKGMPLSPTERTTLMSLVSKGDINGANSFIRSLERFTPLEKAVAGWKDGLISGLVTAEKIAISPLYSLFGAITKPGRIVMSKLLSYMTDVESDVGLSAAENIAAVKSSASGLAHRMVEISEGRSPRLGGPQGPDVASVFGMTMEARPFRDVPGIGGAMSFIDNLIKRTHSALHGVALEPNYEFARMNFSKALARTVVENSGGKLTRADIPRLAAEFAEDEGVKMMAADRAFKQTFLNQNMMSKGLSMLRNWLERNYGVPGKVASTSTQFFIPFARISANLIARGAEMTPLGFAGAGLQFVKLMRLAREGIMSAEGVVDVGRAMKVMEAQAEFTRKLAMAGAGTMTAFAFGYFMHKNGLMTASRAESPEEKKIWDIQGRGPFMFSGDGGKTWVNPALLGPFALAMSIGSEAHAMISDPTASAGEKLVGGTLGMVEPVARESFMENVGAAMSGLSGEPGGKARFAREATQSLVPNIVRESARAVDPFARMPSGLVQGIEANIPWLSRNVPARMGAGGTPLTHATGINAFLPQPWPSEEKLHYPSNVRIEQATILEAQYRDRINAIYKQMEAVAGSKDAMAPNTRHELMNNLKRQLIQAGASYKSAIHQLLGRH